MNVKPGDLAIVVGARITPENIGKIVSVVRQARPGEFAGGYQGLVWIVHNDSGLIQRSLDGLIKWTVNERPMRDYMLKPVSGLPDEQHTEEDNKLEA